ncbi:MAG: glutathione S-transferase family protein [Alphaproteobacteria bacterium]|nr:glutathione S-transferase family protein [Alphaproteobacteria bacterium]
MLTLYHGLASTCSKKVRLALFEKGLDFESRLLNLQAFEQHSPEYLAVNPNGVVPTLVHDGRAVVESTLIIEYIDEVWPDPPLKPADPYDRACMRLWTKWSDEHAYKAVYVPTWDRLSRPIAIAFSDEALAARLAHIPTAERRARWRATAREGFTEAEFEAAYGEMHLTFAKMDEALAETGGPWLMGDAYTLADIAMVPFVERIIDLKPDILNDGAYPRVADWMARYRERPAFQAAFFFDGKDARVSAIRKQLGID